MPRTHLLRRFEQALADARVILRGMSSGERSDALIAARAQRIGVELMIAREIGVFVSDGENEALRRLGAQGARVVSPSVVS